eukprot:TRINITY_DN15083_c0_g1_i1.p1 TRINITY_DN15083_c0_g1~~TRINITY_DN15083_c0_g1_i1.p1  ORF type:complete len:275 (+),score=53.12 TRINITY_DN15083_c0_g1_i1:44-826(+)
MDSSASGLPRARDWGWALQAWYDSPATPAIPKLALVVLSTPLSASLLRRVWELAEKRIVADGGANVVHRTQPDLIPDVLVGDLDSANAEAVEFFKAEGVDVRDMSSDQDTTDLEKSLAVAESFSCEKVIVAGKFAGVEGRLDHTFGIFNALYKSLSRNQQVALVSDDCCCFLLGEGEHEIPLAHQTDTACGLVPLGGICHSISTRGLCWDMQEASMQFGQLVSTSNRIDPKKEGPVWVRTSSPVLWMCSLPASPGCKDEK